MEKKYYIIDYPFGNNGFFAYMCFVFGQLDYAYSNNLIPFVDFTKSHLSDGSINLFYEFFESKFPIDEELNFENSVMCPRTFDFIVQGVQYSWPVGYPPRSSKIFRMKDVVSNINFLFNHFFEVKKDVLAEIPQDIRNFRTLGVHCRRSDMSAGHPENVFVESNEDFFSRTMKVFDENGFEKIYLASDEQEIVDYFNARVPEKLIFQREFKRWQPKEYTAGMTPFWSTVGDNKEDNLGYFGIILARQVLVDALAMSMCDSLVSSISGVTYGSIIFNGLKYSDVYYFDEIKIE